MDKKEEQKFDPNLWLALFNTACSCGNSSNILLEKQVAYLNGKVDVLEKLILKMYENELR